VELLVRRHEGEIEFVVADTGPGIPADLRDQLFKPFARLAPNASAGSGLGLALVHGLVQAMGGEVWLDESAPQGATFVARLPLAPCPEPVAAAPVEMPQIPLHGMTVLLAEDNTLVAELLRTFLSSHGAIVLTATDGVAAEKLARESTPDVLLLDIGLPERDGITVARNLRRDTSLALRIIGLSAHAGPQEEARAREAGMDEFLTKPVNLAHLGHVLGSARKRALAATAPARIDDPKLRTLLAAQFAEETPRVLEQLRAAASAKDWAQMRSRAHYLKNSADVIGAADLQLACRNVMQVDGAPDPEVVRRLIDAVTAAVPTRPFASTATPESPKPSLPGTQLNHEKKEASEKNRA
jgi:CheY-like chemotaxis protein